MRPRCLLAWPFVGLFAPPSGLGEWGLFAWLAVFAILTRARHELYHVPHLALGAEMTENFNERTRVVAYRQFFSAAGAAGAWIIGLIWFFSDDRGGRLAPTTIRPLPLPSRY